jgi:hypothetical protein
VSNQALQQQTGEKGDKVDAGRFTTHSKNELRPVFRLVALPASDLQYPPAVDERIESP